MKDSKPSVLVTFDSMKYPNTGLYYFGKSLGKALAAQNRDKFALSYYLNHKANELFSDVPVERVFKKQLHKIFFPGKAKYSLYHFTDQYCRLKPQFVKGKKILTIHDLNPVHELNEQPDKLQAYLDKLQGFINECDRVVAISNFVANDVLKYFPSAKGKISTIYNGADKLVAEPGHKPKYEPKGRFLFTIGMLSEKKNFHVLPALLVDNDFELIISGIDTPYRDKIIAEAIKLGVNNRLVITGPVVDNDKAWYYQNCEAFVFPSIAEGFGLPVIEAMHFGKPVFLSKYTSLPEIGEHKAYYFDSFNATEMQSVLANGLEHYYKTNAAEAIKAHADKFSWSNTTQEYLNLYWQMIGE